MHALPTELYSSLADDEDLKDLVELFVEEMPQRVDTLITSLETIDWSGLRRAAHQLKGSAGSYGFPPISAAAARVEQAVSAQEPEENIRRATEELIELCRRVRSGSPRR